MFRRIGTGPSTIGCIQNVVTLAYPHDAADPSTDSNSRIRDSEYSCVEPPAEYDRIGNVLLPAAYCCLLLPVVACCYLLFLTAA